MIDSYSADEVYADNRHLQCQLNKEKGDTARLQAAHDKLCADFNELMIERDRLFDEAEAGFKIRDGRIEALVKDLDATADRLNGSSAVIEGLNARIRKLEELVLAIEHDACGVYANCSDWFGVRDKLFS